MKLLNQGKMGIIVIIVAGLLGLGVFIALHEKVDPRATLDVKITKEQASKIAKEFFEQNNLNVSDYKEAIIFDSDEEVSVFLQRTLGIEKTSEISKSDVSLWYWNFRAFKPLEKEEFLVSIEPSSGEVIDFAHLVAEEKEGSNLEQQEAGKIAEDYIQGKLGINLSDYERVEASSEKMKNRTDHFFEWKRKDFNIEGSELRIMASVQGSEIGTFGRYLKVPEDFTRKYEKESSTGALLGIISLVLMFFIVVSAFIVFIKKYKSNDIRWKFSLVISITLLVLFILEFANTTSSTKMEYMTEVGYFTFWTIILIMAVIGAIFYGISIIITGSAGDALTREVYPRSIGFLNDLLTKKRIFTREFFANTFIGYFGAFSFLAMFLSSISLRRNIFTSRL